MPITVVNRMSRLRKSRIVKRIRHEQLQQQDPEYASHPAAAKAESEIQAVDAKLAPKQDFNILDPSLAITDIRDATGRLKKAQAYLDGHKAGMRNLKPLLPIMFNLNGKPYRIDDHFPFEPFYHVRMCQNMVWKTGRQVSKTGRKNSKFNRVYDSYGRRYRLEDLDEGQSVQSLNVDTFQPCDRKVLFKHHNPVKTCYYIRTRRGVEMELAGTHPLYTYDGWTTVDDLDVGARIIHVREGGKFGRKKVDNRRIRITAYMLGDGSFRGNYTFTANRSTSVIAEMRSLLKDFREYRKSKSKASSLHINRDHPLHAWARQDGLHGKLSHEKHIPDWVFLLSRADTRTFIERLWATDGMVKPGKSKATITYTSTSRELVYDLKSLLAKFGIPTSVKKRTGAYRKPDGRRVECRQYWVLRVETLVGWQKFMEEFGVPDKPGFELPDREPNNNRYTVPAEIGELIADIAGECRGTSSEALLQYGLRKKPKYPPSRKKMRQYLEFFRKHRPEHPRLDEFAKYVEGAVDWDEIVEIRCVGDHECIDIEVEDTHCYIFDGVLSHNSTNQAAQGVMYANLEPYFNTLFVTPLFELIRRFSSNYVAPFINLSPVKSLMVDSTCTNSVLQRSFRNQSTLYFSFAFLNADRTRGLNCGKNVYDEIQDMDPEFIPIIRETMSAHKWGGISQYTGTPKTKSNTLHQLWLMSSQAELVIPCKSCNHFNIPHIDHDLDAMMGPTIVKRSISEESPAVVCAKCGKPLNPRIGRWDHLYSDLKWKYSGYHVPQCIMPMHYANEEKWGVLLGKREGFGGTTPNVFYNEVCGEAYDTGAALITETDLRRAAVLPWENTFDQARANFQPGNYVRRILGVDWGGGGEKMVSLTSAAVVGQLPDGKLDVIYGWRSRSPHAHVEEAKYILHLMREFRCTHLAHDMQGAGTARESIIKLAGLPENLIIPISYVRLGVGPMIKWVPYNQNTGQRSHHRLDKTRSLVNTSQLIKYGHIRFFQYDYKGVDQPGMMNDFLSLTEDYIANRSAAETYTIIRDEKAGPDDFANAVNYATCAIFHQAKKWPDVANMVKVKISPQMLAEISLPDDFNWE